MLQSKYYDKIIAAQHAGPVPGAPREFDFSVLGGGGGVASRLIGWIISSQFVYTILRNFFPVLQFGSFCVVSRYDDVKQVLDRNDVFEGPFKLEMPELAGGTNFLLGMPRGPEHDRQLKFIRAAMHVPGDVDSILAPVSARLANELIEVAGGRIDAVADLLTPVVTEACGIYFGLAIEDRNAFAEWSMTLSQLLFGDPTGNVDTRRLALLGAARLRAVVKQSIERAHTIAVHLTLTSNAEKDWYRNTLVGRMVAQQVADPANGPRDDEIMAMLIGMLVGFVPSISLGGGNLLDVLLSKSEALHAATAAACKGDDAQLARCLFEAMRFKAPLTPGPFRYATEDFVLRGHTIRKGTTVAVASASAMFDPRVIDNPRVFDPDRKQATDLLFGGMGTLHYCVGELIAKAVITQIYKPLLSQAKLARATGRSGQLKNTGAFPRNLQVTYEPTIGHHFQSMVTICVPVTTGVTASQLDAVIGALGNPAGPSMSTALTATQRVHFASVSAIRAEPDGDIPTHVLVELSVDGPEGSAIDEIVNTAGKDLLPVFKLACGLVGMGALAPLLREHVAQLAARPGDPSGLNFPGTPELSVPRIAKEQVVAEAARKTLEAFLRDNAHNGPMATQALSFVRQSLRDNGMGWALLRPASQTPAVARRTDLSTSEAIWSLISDRKFMRKFVSLVVAAWVGYVLVRRHFWGPGIIPFVQSDLPAMLHALWRLAFSLIYGGLAVATAIGLAAIFKYLPSQKQDTALVPKKIAPAKAAGMLFGLPRVGVISAALAAGLFHFIALRQNTGIASWVSRTALGRLSDALRFVVEVFASFAGAMTLLAIVIALLAGAFVWWLRRNEKLDPVEDLDPPFDHVRELLNRENQPGFRQNHLIAVTELKTPRLLRRLTLMVAFWGVEMLVKHRFRPGFVLDIGTIHFARWFRLPGTNKLIFLANYDGSWESYLEDFITKAHGGQTAVWSNGVGFPKARFLLLDGAQDGDRFKRWVRRQQVPTRFWYTRFPAATTSEIRNNTLICEGLAKAVTESSAHAWLDLFNSRPRPQNAMETNEIQSLAFGRLNKLVCSQMVALQFPRDTTVADMADKAKCRQWLQDLMAIQPLKTLDTLAFEMFKNGPRVSFGDVQPNDRGCILSLSAKGLQRLGVPGLDIKDSAADDQRSFPAAFVQGMADRSRLLGDAGSSESSKWTWGQPDSGADHTEPDAVLLLYAKDDGELKSYSEFECQKWLKFGLSEIVRVPLQMLVREMTEPFGFRDGVSQPVIRGSKRYHEGTNPIHVVEPGEFVLGYTDNRGYFPPTPTVSSEDDPGHYLPSLPVNMPDQYPNYSDCHTGAPLDFGRNGSFLVIRQLQQDVPAFQNYCLTTADALDKSYKNLNITPAWIGAKLVGRWHNGSSLVRNPDTPDTTPDSAPDNDYMFGIDDPQGLRCPYGAHVRRSNPRDSFQPGSQDQLDITNRHRILRVGRPYVGSMGEESKQQGLLFMCLNADIERQFEFVQQTWVGSPSFHGLQGEADPIAGGSNTLAQTGTFTIPTPAGPLILQGLSSFVTVRGGGYFFLPSRSALRYLATKAG